MVDMMLSWNPKGALLTSKFAIININNTYLPNDVNDLLSPLDFHIVMILLLSHSRSLFYLMYLISWNKVCQVIACILSAYYLSFAYNGYSPSNSVTYYVLLHPQALLLDFRNLCLNSELSRRSCMIVRTGHITTGLSGLSPFDEFMRIQVSNMETFKMESYFPGLCFTVIVDRYFVFMVVFFSKQQRIGTCFDYMCFPKG